MRRILPLVLALVLVPAVGLAAEPPDAAIDLGFVGPVASEANFTLSVNVTNSGGKTGPGETSLSVSAPSGATISAVSAAGWNCTHTGSTASCVINSTFKAGHSSTLTLTVGVTAGAGTKLTFRASISAAGDNNSSNNSDSLTLLVGSGVNSAPSAASDTASTAEGTKVDIDVLANDSDPDGNLDPGTLAISSAPPSGKAAVSGGQVHYIPDVGFVGFDTFSYQICDVAGACDTASVTVLVGVAPTTTTTTTQPAPPPAPKTTTPPPVDGEAPTDAPAGEEGSTPPEDQIAAAVISTPPTPSLEVPPPAETASEELLLGFSMVPGTGVETVQVLVLPFGLLTLTMVVLIAAGYGMSTAATGFFVLAGWKRRRKEEEPGTVG